MGYLNDNHTPYANLVDLPGDTEGNLYDMSYNKFLGFRNDNASNKTLTYTTCITRQLADNISVRAAHFGSSCEVNNANTSIKTVVNKEYNMCKRAIPRSLCDDRNSILRPDLIGRDIFTDPVKHTFQLELDYKSTDLPTTNYIPVNIDIISVLAPSTSNVLPVAVKFIPETPVESSSSGYGIVAQGVMTFDKHIKAILGLRYSCISDQDGTDVGPTTEGTWNPMLGTTLTPIKDINLFGSYTTTTNLPHTARRMKNGDEVGPSNIRQFEIGIKPDWLNNRLHFNLTYLDVPTKNLSYSAYHPGTT